MADVSVIIPDRLPKYRLSSATTQVLRPTIRTFFTSTALARSLRPTLLPLFQIVCQSADIQPLALKSSAEIQTLAAKMIFRLPRSHPATVIRCRRYEDINSSVCKFCSNLQMLTDKCLNHLPLAAPDL